MDIEELDLNKYRGLMKESGSLLARVLESVSGCDLGVAIAGILCGLAVFTLESSAPNFKYACLLVVLLLPLSNVLVRKRE